MGDSVYWDVVRVWRCNRHANDETKKHAKHDTNDKKGRRASLLASFFQF